MRDALALLADSDDFRVRALTDAEPLGCLGPFAVVDVILGTEAAVAALREQTGYYEMVRKVAEESARATPLPAPAENRVPRTEPAPLAVSASPQTPAPALAPAAGRGRAKAVNEKIAPHKRRSSEVAPDAQAEPSLPSTAFLPKRNLPAPRGRFTTLDPSRSPFESLFQAEGKEIVRGLIAQVSHRVDLLRALELSYVAKRGQTLRVGDVEDLIEHHEPSSLSRRSAKACWALDHPEGVARRAAHSAWR